jgi:hypothetical protein
MITSEELESWENLRIRCTSEESVGEKREAYEIQLLITLCKLTKMRFWYDLKIDTILRAMKNWFENFDRWIKVLRDEISRWINQG